MDTTADRPWLDAALPAAERADLLLAQLTLEEKIGLVHAPMGVSMFGHVAPEGALGSAGYNPGVPRLGVPPLHETDASLGVANPEDARPDADATALPSGLSLAATFDPALAEDAGAVIGIEARAAGFGVLLAGGVNLTREPRCGRNFEYLGEDALLAGTLAGASVAGIQAQGIISTVKHLAVNAQETGRTVVSSELSEAAARASDLLAFELAIERGRPLSVMSAYNWYAGEPCSESAFLLTTVLKQDWGFDGFVMSDWGGTLSTVEAALAGLDRQSGEHLDPEVYFGAPLLEAVRTGAVPQERLDDMVRRILLAMTTAGLLDPRPPVTADLAAHATLAWDAAARGAVLLTNDGVLPFAADLGHLLVVGDHADTGVLSGGGSSQVRPRAYARPHGPGDPRVYHPSSLVAALREALPGVRVEHVAGTDRAAAVTAARAAGAVVVVAEQWTTEGADVPDLALPDHQDGLIADLAAANPRTVVLLQTGGPVLLPWIDDVAAVLQGWYPGGEGGPALAAVLTGATEPGGRLPVTFPRGAAQLPRPQLDAPSGVPSNPGLPRTSSFSVDYDIEGADVGYRWFDREGHAPRFWFGHGLTWTTFAYADLSVDVTGGDVVVSVDVTNTGDRTGTAVPQFYAAAPHATARLVGWRRIDLAPGATAQAQATVDPRLLSRWDVAARRWRIAPGTYRFSAGASAGDRPLQQTIELTGDGAHPPGR